MSSFNITPERELGVGVHQNASLCRINIKDVFMVEIRKDYEKLFSHFKTKEPSVGLFDRIILAIKREQELRHTKRLLFVFLFLLVASFIATPLSWTILVSQAENPGILYFISTAVSDFRTFVALWQDFGLAILESLPITSLIIFVITILVVGAGAFYGGMKYQESKIVKERQQTFQQFGANATGGSRVSGRTNSNMLGGEIIAKDDKSITIKLRDGQGGSKIVFFSDSTKITKSAEGSINDLEISKTVFVGGKQNADGSFTAETIQLSPSALPNQ